MQKHLKVKTGAASFYIVAVMTLIVTIIAMSFVGIIISEVVRTSKNDLSNSAYDSALAGIEDAKLAIQNYQSCINQGATSATYAPTGSAQNCAEIIWYMENAQDDCDMVAKILGRQVTEDGVVIEESTSGTSTMEQSYTCVTIATNANTYSAMISSDTTQQIIPLSIDGDASDVKSINIKWFSDNDGLAYNYANSNGFGSASNQLATPPTLSVQLIQTSGVFYISDFDKTINGETDRGTLFLVPNNGATGKSHGYVDSSHQTVSASPNSTDVASFYDITSNNILKNSDSQNFAKANDKTTLNTPILVNCAKNSGAAYACSVSIELPDPVQNTSDDNSREVRNNDSFMLFVSLPYGGVDTEIAVQVCTDTECTDQKGTASGNAIYEDFANNQYIIDSTGRASDLYRRVRSVVDGTDIYYSSTNYTVELLSEGNSLIKDVTVYNP